MYVSRNIANQVEELCRYFPVISVTGPRQAGKTTFLKAHFTGYDYVSLEDPDVRLRAEQDPRGFLERYHHHVIFDEAQRLPELFSYLQTLVDQDRVSGRFIVSGSQNFLLHQKIGQSLAGRVGVARLFPFDFDELKAESLLSDPFEEAIFKGFYPATFQTGIPAHLFYPNYVSTYLERDVGSLVNPSNLSIFQNFLKLCAANTGQILNYSRLSKIIGVSVPTIKQWLSIIERSYLIFLLPPYYRNLGKRIVKSPKLYFYDTGLLCYLLGMQSPKDVANYYQLGAVFENLVVAERKKAQAHRGSPIKQFYYRDSNQIEIDLLEEEGNTIRLIEIKAARTIMDRQFKNMNTISRLIKERDVDRYLIYGGEERAYHYQEVQICSWKDLDRV